MSYHEVGHALLSALQKNSEPVQKITIVPRTMGALGYVMQVPEEEKYLNTKEELHDMIVGFLGGRAAEEIVFGSVTTGASNDIEKATSIARSMVTQYGMSDKFGLVGLETVESRYLDGRTVMNCADKTAAEVDSEVIAIIAGCYEEAKKLLSENREIMDKIAAHLIEKETITGREFMEIYCAEKGIPVPEPKNPLGKSKDEKKAEKKEEEPVKEAEKPEEKAEDIPFEGEKESEKEPEASILESYKDSEEKAVETAEEEKPEEPEEKADEKSEFEQAKEELKEQLSPEEKAEIEEMEKAKEEISNEVFKRIQNRAFKFEDDEEEK